MFAHISVGARDLDEARAFYDAVLAPLGVSLFADDRDAGWLTYRKGRGRPSLEMCLPRDGNPATVGNGVNVGLLAQDRASVRAAHAAGLDNGGTDEGAPGLRAHYHPDWYGAYLRDPTGNKLCIVCHEPE
jgi:catechol 2,3-dioxygenase-like lactoylglutathione lyase family enzyme